MACVLSVYLRSDISTAKLFAGIAVMGLWSCSPYAAIALSEKYLSSSLVSEATALSVLVIAATIGLGVFSMVILKPSDGQAGLALVLVPVLQWIGGIITIFLIAVVKWLTR